MDGCRTWPRPRPDVQLGHGDLVLFVGTRHRHRSHALSLKNTLRVLRAERNLSQADLAALLGVSRQTVNALEVGKYDPSLPLAFKIARTFARPIEAIFIFNNDS